MKPGPLHRACAILVGLWVCAPPIAAAAADLAAARSPSDEQRSFRLTDPALAIELVAAEPQVESPVAIAWDAHGRLFVAEMRDYPAGPASGRIRLLEDRDRDGHYETSTVFAQDLAFPNGVLPWNGGVLVTCAPDILFLRDRDGDGRADERRVLLTGFAQGNQQLLVNGLLWNIDGWVYGANGRSDGDVRHPGDTAAQSIRGQDFRFDPASRAFEPIAGRSQFGLARDDWGNRFLSWNTIFIRHDVIPTAGLRRLTHRDPAAGLNSLIPASDNGQVFPLAPPPPTFNRESTSHFNALAGLSIYRGNGLPRAYYGNAFAGESLRNLVHRRVLEPAGASFVARRAEERSEFLASSDPWFHPVNFATGPDGAFYIVDFYRQWVEHPGFVPESLRTQFEWRTGSNRGRLWRVRSVSSSTLQPFVPPAQRPASALAGFLEHPNAWQRDTAQRLIVEQKPASALPALSRIAHSSTMPEARATALHTLVILSAPVPIDHALRDPDPRVRAVALELAASHPRLRPATDTHLPRLARDPDARVRLKLALLLGVDSEGSLGAPNASSGPEATLAQLASRPDLDPWVRLAIEAAAMHHPEKLLKVLTETATPAQVRNGEWIALLRSLAYQLSAASEPRATSWLIDWLLRPVPDGSIDDGRLAAAAGSLAGAAARTPGSPAPGFDWLASFAGTRFTAMAVASVRARVGASPPNSAPIPPSALDFLGRSRSPDAHRVLVDLLEPATPQASAPVEPRASAPSLPNQAAAALAHVDALEAWQRVFATWATRPVALRPLLLAAAGRNPASHPALAAALTSGELRPAELTPQLRKQLLDSRDSALVEAAQRAFASLRPAATREEAVRLARPALDLVGDPQRGALTFTRLCAVCHRIAGAGGEVGPDLSGIGVRPKEALLLDIIDPSRQVAADFEAYEVTLRSGESLTGLLISETANGVTLRRPSVADEVTPRSEIRSLRPAGVSLMPDGLESGLSPSDLADLLAFLGAPL